MPYKVIEAFQDLEHENTLYLVGDTFPQGYEVSEERIQALLTGKNKRGIPLIEVVKGITPEVTETAETAKKAPSKRTRKKKVEGE